MDKHPRIDSYGFGHVEIDGTTYTSDVIILPDGVRGDWWRDEGHSVTRGDLASVVEAGADVLVIGQGAHGCMKVPDETAAWLRESGIEPVAAVTPRAVEAYNQHARRGVSVAAALHLTC